MGLQKPPGLVVRFRPALSKNAAANLAVVGQLAQPFLHGDPNVSTGAGRTVAVDQLEQGLSPLARGGEFAVETSKGFVYLRHLRLEVYGFDGGLQELDAGVSLLAAYHTLHHRCGIDSEYLGK
jgi:hypothetical protein